MAEIIEGVGNEVTLTFTFLTVAAAILVPWYFMRPRRSQRDPQDSSNSRPHSSRETVNTENVRNNGQSIQSPVQGPLSSEVRNRTTGSEQYRTSTPNQQYSQPIGFRPSFLPQDSPIPTSNDNTPSSSERDLLINVRVKLISESERPFQVPQSMKLVDFKKLCFPDEFHQGKLIRFIYSGRILQPDTETLQHFGIGDGYVVHAQISQRQNNTSSAPTAPISEDLDLSGFLVPVLTFALILGWLAIFTFDGIFTWTSIVILGFLTVLMVITSWL